MYKIIFYRVLLFVFVLSFLFVNTSSYTAIAGVDIYPVELAIPNQPLVQDEEADFFIIVNDEKIRQEINYFLVYFPTDGKNPQKIEYQGESYIKFKRKMPSLSSSAYIQIKIEAYSTEQEKYLFRVFKNVQYDLKYPLGLLPSTLSSQAQESLKKKDYFSFSDMRAEYKEGEDKGMGYSDPSVATYFSTDFVKDYNQDDSDKLLQDKKSSLHELLTKTYLRASEPQINSSEIKTDGGVIERIVLLNASNANDTEGKVFYDCYSYVYVFVKNDQDTQKQKVYSFEFRKFGKNIASGIYQGQIDSFQSMVKAFADSVSMEIFDNTNFEDKMQTISVSTNMNPHPVFTDYDLNALHSSSIYAQIMAGETPGVEALKKEKKEMDDREFNISFRYENNKTIWNSGVVNTGTDKDTSFAISVNIDIKAFDKGKKEITDISDEDLYKDVYLMYKIVNPKSQIYFQEANIGDNKLKVKVDDVIESQYLQSIGPVLYKGPFLPTEYVVVSLVDKKDRPLTGRYLYTVHMKDASPRIEMEENVKEIDDVADSVFKFKINDEYHDKVKCSVKVPYEKYLANHIPVIKVSNEGLGDVGSYIPPFECETNKWITIRVKSPKLSNFNMLSELNGLNMWDLQRGTMETFATDLVGFGIDRRMASLKKSKQALEGLYTKGYTGAKGVFKRVDKIEKTMRVLDRANGLAGDAQNAIKLTQISKNAKSHADDKKKATEINGTKTIMESAYDWGIGGINILQSTVGAIAMVPGHIPFVGKYAQKVTGTFSLVFNLMTNVWKGNLEYLSKEKKIDRAQEKSIPYPIMVGVESKEGFRDADAETISVLYTYLEK